jgi:RNA polymerase sigma-70 factor (ECF subfamily)
VARGDSEALRALYRRHHVAVRAFAARLLGDEHSAEDLVHDVFVALPRAIKGFRAEAALEGYLIGIAANRVDLAKAVAESGVDLLDFAALPLPAHPKLFLRIPPSCPVKEEEWS